MYNESSKYDNLEGILKDQSSKPHALPLQFLKEITNNFSDERVLGEGGTGVVYKGVLKSGEIMAVKRLASSTMGAQSLFQNEVCHLIRLKHPNIVRIIGYCYETTKTIIDYKGKDVLADITEMLLCLEYLPKGSLDVFLSDGSSEVDWQTRYNIIEGVCNGLHYLHKQIDKSIRHLDLKPANVLLDDNLTPKITDFGLSRLLDQHQTIFAPNRAGTLGYMAPEYIDEGTITPKSDIFSLGVMVMELITGHRDYPGVDGTSYEGFIELELEKWRNMLDRAQGYTKLEIDCKQIRRCIQIGLSCVHPDSTKRPTTTKILKMLQGLGSSDCNTSSEATSPTDQQTEGWKPHFGQTSVSLSMASDCLSGKLKLLYLDNQERNSSRASVVRIAIPGAPAGTDLHVHPYVLSARSPYLRAVFARHTNHYCAAGGGEEGGRMELREFLGEEVEVGYEALLLVLEYMYSGRIGDLPKSACVCLDDDGCAHFGCHPTVSFKVQVLFAAYTFQVAELTNLFQRDLLNVLDLIEVVNLPMILSVANLCNKSCMKLLERSFEMVVRSNLDMITLEKALPPDVIKQITNSRLSLGLVSLEDKGFPNKHVRRIYRALDNDDVELVWILLKEGQTNLDDAFALHYAAEYCEWEIITELLDMALADVNHRNPRGYTALHIAARRRDPKIIASLLNKGARPLDFAFDGRKALQISKRFTKHGDYIGVAEEGKLSPKDRLCIEMLERADRRDPQLGEASMPLAIAGDGLHGNLVYLENRVALARVMFPVEARIAMDIAKVDGTLEFTLCSSANPPSEIQRVTVDVNETPFQMKEEHLARMRALSKTVELGKRFFPCCSNVLDKIMDDEADQLASLGRDTSTERKRRFQDLQDVLQKAFDEDKEFNRSAISSSSSSTTTSIGAGRLAARPRR